MGTGVAEAGAVIRVSSVINTSAPPAATNATQWKWSKISRPDEDKDDEEEGEFRKASVLYALMKTSAFWVLRMATKVACRRRFASTPRRSPGAFLCSRRRRPCRCRAGG